MARGLLSFPSIGRASRCLYWDLTTTSLFMLRRMKLVSFNNSMFLMLEIMDLFDY